MKKSMIIDHPFWDKIKAKRGTIDPMSGLEVKEFILPSRKYWKYLERLLVK